MARTTKQHFSRTPWLVLSGILLGLVVLVQNFDTPRNLLTEALGQPANLVVNTGEVVQTVRPVWEGVAQGGEGEQALLSGIQNSNDVTIRLIRIDHVFDQYDLVSRGPSGLVYDFSHLDRVVNTILASGAQPFFSLSYLPPVLSSTGQVDDSPADWDEWRQIVHRFIMHYSGVRERNLPNIYYEVWNEPDLYGSWRITGPKNYLDLYRHAARAALQANPTQPFFIGGPGTTGMYPNWIQALYKLSQEEQLPFSFISWHRYSLKPEDLAKDLQWVKDWQVQQSFPRLPLIISEWGFDSDLNSGYDTEVSAAHMVSAITQSASLAYEMFAFELMDGPDPNGQQLWGRWGMMTNQSFGVIKKPRYRALRLLQGLGTQQLRVTGEGTWVKALFTRTDAQISGVISNYDSRDRHWEQVPITFTGLADSEYRLTIRRLNGLSEDKTITPSRGLWQTQIAMPANEVIRINLSTLP